MSKNLDRLQVMRHENVAFDSGANPDFQVTSATRNAREMQRMLHELNLKSRLIDRRMAGLDTAEAMRQQALAEHGSAQQAEAVVIEDIDPAAPK